MSTVPGAPTGLVSAPGNTTAILTFTAGSDGGSPITNYKYSTDGTTYTALTTPQTTSPITIPGLTNYVWYTIYIKAVNAVGDSVASAGVTVLPSIVPYTPQSMGTVLKVWYDGKDPYNTTVLPANGASVTSWINKAGYTSYNTTASGRTKPIYDLSQNALYFNGVYYDTGYTACPRDEMMFIVFKSADGTNLRVIGGGGAGGRGVAQGGTINSTTSIPNTIGIINGSYYLASAAYTPNTVGLVTVRTYTYTGQPGSTVLTLMGNSITLNDVGLADTTANGPWWPGTNLTTVGSSSSPVYIMEILIYNTYNASVSTELVQGYLAWKWGIQSSLSSSNSYSLTVTGSPRSLVATSLDSSARIAFVAPTSGGYSIITNYKYSIDGGTTYTALNPPQTTSPITIVGLTNGASYSVCLKAVNPAGDGTASSAVSATPYAKTPVVVFPSAITPFVWLDASDSTTITAASNAVSAISNKGVVVNNIPFNIKTGTVTTGVDTIGGLNVISFSEGSQLMSAASYSRGSSGFSVFSVYKAVTAPNVTNYIVYVPTTAGGHLFAYGSHDATSNTNAFSAGSSNLTRMTTETNTPSLLNTITMVAIINATTVSNNTVTVHGTAYTLIAHGYAATSTNATNFAYYLNGHPTGSGQQQIAETIVCNSAVTVAQRQQIEGYLAWKWSTQALLPSIHPYAPLTAPTITSVTASGTTATIVFTAPPATGPTGSTIPITGYKYSTDGGNTYTTTGSTATTFTFSVTAGASFIMCMKAVNAYIGDNGASSTNVPYAPTNVSATGGNNSATVSFSPPIFTGSSDIVSYVVTSTPDGVTGTGTSSPIVVTGLVNQPYTFTVNATNSEGTSAESSASAAVTPVTAPDAPIMLYATVGNAQATVYWTAPSANGGMPVTSYTLKVYSSMSMKDSVTTVAVPSSITVTTTQCTMTGLTNDAAYTFVVMANNSVGTSDPSAATNAVIPSGTSALCRVQFRRGPSAVWSAVNPILGQGELAIETDTQNFKVGDATTTWTALPYGGITGATGPAVGNIINAATTRLITTDSVGTSSQAQDALLFSGGTTLTLSTISTTSVLINAVSTTTLSTAQVNVNTLYTNTITSANDITITAPSVTFAGDLAAQNEFYSMYYDALLYNNTDNLVATNFKEHFVDVNGVSISSYTWANTAISYSGQYQIAAAYGAYVVNTTNTSGIVCISSDYGVTWKKVNVTANYYRCAISGSGEYMVAVASNSKIYISPDYGTTWQLPNSPPTGSYTMLGVGVSYSGSYQTYATYTNSTPYNGQIWTSSDYGNTWNITLTTPTYCIPSELTTSASAQYQILGADINYRSSAFLPYLYTSSDYGNTWVAKLWTSLNEIVVNAIAMSSSGKYQVIMRSYTSGKSNSATIWISTNYGDTWTCTLSTSGLKSGGSVSMSLSGQYINVQTLGTYKSSDYGATWIGVGTSDIITFTHSLSGQYQSYAFNTASGGNGTIFTGSLPKQYNSVVASTMGVGMAASTHMLQLKADGAFKPGTTAWTTGSDERIKTNIVAADLDRCYSAIQALQLKYFGWNPAIYGPNVTQDRHVVGFIAQDVKTLFPKSVDILGEYTIGNTTFSQFHTLNTDQIYTANIGAVKRLIQTVDAQQSTVDGFAAAYEAQQSTMQGRYRGDMR